MRFNAPGRLRPALAAAAALAALLAPAHASAAKHPSTVRVGMSDARVCSVKWMISGPHGHRPNVFNKVRGTYTRPLRPGCNYAGKPWGAAVVKFKFRIGYPMRLVKPVAGPFFFDLLRGTKQRPASWVALAAKRLRATEPGVSPMAQKVRLILQSQLGVTEQPYGSNRGPKISYPWPTHGAPSYQSTTGAYGAAWCVSFTQWAFRQAGYGSFADRTAGVFYTVGWARARGYLNARPKAGAIVAFMDGQGHMGTVVKVTASGFVSIEGNASNRVLERFHALGDRSPVFIYLPGVA